MTRHELITAARRSLDEAGDATCMGNQKLYAVHMSTLLDLLLEELVGNVTGAQTKNTRPFNPEEVLADIAIAVKHRTISTNHRWRIVYYHERITCVPIEVQVPPEIVLHEFTEGMVLEGFSVTYWNHLKTNVIELYKELHK